MDPSSLYDDALAAGEGLVEALQRGDLLAAEAALDRQGQLFGAIRAAALPAPAPSLAARLRDQHDRVRAALRDHTQALADALGATGRAAAAQRRYVSLSRQPVVDTAPR